MNNAQLYRSFEECFPRHLSFFTLSQVHGTWPTSLNILSSDFLGSFTVKGEKQGEIFFTLPHFLSLYPSQRAEFLKLFPEKLNQYLAEFLVNIEKEKNIFLFLESPKIFNSSDLYHLERHLHHYQKNKDILKFNLSLKINFENILLECHLLGALNL